MTKHAVTLDMDGYMLNKVICTCGFSKWLDRGIDADRVARKHAREKSGEIIYISKKEEK